MAAGTGDPLDPVLRAVDSPEVLGLFVTLTRAFKGKHILRGRNDSEGFGGHLFDPIRKIQVPLDEMRNALLRLLNAGPGRKQLVERGDVAGNTGYLDAI